MDVESPTGVGRLILSRMRVLGLSFAEVARRLEAREIKSTRQTVNGWVKGGHIPRRETAEVLAEILQVPLSALAPDPERENVTTPYEPAAVARRVPLIDWVQAGRGALAVNPYSLGVGSDYVEVDFVVSDRTFALEVQGDSMEPEFREGDRIVVDPGVAPRTGEYVVAELLTDGAEPGAGIKTLKQYKPRGTDQGVDTFDLIPLNPSYETRTVNRANPGRIIGTVVEHRRRFRTPPRLV